MCSKLCCPLCSESAFISVDVLRLALIEVTTKPLTCPLCRTVCLGLDKLTIHLFGHGIAGNKDDREYTDLPEYTKNVLSISDTKNGVGAQTQPPQPKSSADENNHTPNYVITIKQNTAQGTTISPNYVITTNTSLEDQHSPPSYVITSKNHTDNQKLQPSYGVTKNTSSELQPKYSITTNIGVEGQNSPPSYVITTKNLTGNQRIQADYGITNKNSSELQSKYLITTNTGLEDQNSPPSYIITTMGRADNHNIQPIYMPTTKNLVENQEIVPNFVITTNTNSDDLNSPPSYVITSRHSLDNQKNRQPNYIVPTINSTNDEPTTLPKYIISTINHNHNLTSQNPQLNYIVSTVNNHHSSDNNRAMTQTNISSPNQNIRDQNSVIYNLDMETNVLEEETSSSSQTQIGEQMIAEDDSAIHLRQHSLRRDSKDSTYTDIKTKPESIENVRKLLDFKNIRLQNRCKKRLHEICMQNAKKYNTVTNNNSVAMETQHQEISKIQQEYNLTTDYIIQNPNVIISNIASNDYLNKSVHENLRSNTTATDISGSHFVKIDRTTKCLKESMIEIGGEENISNRRGNGFGSVVVSDKADELIETSGGGGGVEQVLSKQVILRNGEIKQVQIPAKFSLRPSALTLNCQSNYRNDRRVEENSVENVNNNNNNNNIAKDNCKTLEKMESESVAITTNAVTLEKSQCDMCGFNFENSELLAMHVFLAHDSNQALGASGGALSQSHHQELYACGMCDKTFRVPAALILHRTVKHDVDGKSSTNQSAERGQQQNHQSAVSSSSSSVAAAAIVVNSKSDLKQWDCDVCAKRFTTKYFLKKHKRLHTGEMPYTCSRCDRSFTFQQSYHKHLLYHTDDRPHVCQHCGRAFRELSTLHNHQRIHTGEKPFACETCGKAFRQRVSYLVHRRIHTGAMPYKCAICDKSFRYKVSQRTHKCPGHPPGVTASIPSIESNNSVTNHDPITQKSIKIDINNGNGSPQSSVISTDSHHKNNTTNNTKITNAATRKNITNLNIENIRLLDNTTTSETEREKMSIQENLSNNESDNKLEFTRQTGGHMMNKLKDFRQNTRRNSSGQYGTFQNTNLCADNIGNNSKYENISSVTRADEIPHEKLMTDVNMVNDPMDYQTRSADRIGHDLKQNTDSVMEFQVDTDVSGKDLNEKLLNSVPNELQLNRLEQNTHIKNHQTHILDCSVVKPRTNSVDDKILNPAMAYRTNKLETNDIHSILSNGAAIEKQMADDFKNNIIIQYQDNQLTQNNRSPEIITNLAIDENGYTENTICQHGDMMINVDSDKDLQETLMADAILDATGVEEQEEDTTNIDTIVANSYDSMLLLNDNGAPSSEEEQMTYGFHAYM